MSDIPNIIDLELEDTGELDYLLGLSSDEEFEAIQEVPEIENDVSEIAPKTKPQEEQTEDTHVISKIRRNYIPMSEWIMPLARKNGCTISENDIELLDLTSTGYIMNNRIKRGVNSAIVLNKGIFVKGKPGCGKTELAISIWKACGGRTDMVDGIEKYRGPRLIKLVCNPNIDHERKVVGEYDTAGQLIALEILRSSMSDSSLTIEEKFKLAKGKIYAGEFFIKRAIAEALMDDEDVDEEDLDENGDPPGKIVLIDEADKSKFIEGFLLEFLDKHQVTVPQLGTIRAHKIPLVVITANQNREFSEEFLRRCQFIPVSYPDVATECKIIMSKLPGIRQSLAMQISIVMEKLRQCSKFRYTPGTSATIDWAYNLVRMNIESITAEELLLDSGILMKTENDVKILEENAGRFLP
jgi:MoxR-like ATPase